MQGRFIVIEGPDGAGTTLHSRLLAERLTADGVEVILTAEPTDNAIGQGIRALLAEGGVGGAALQLLFCADRAEHVSQVILPALAEGKTVITDRYIPSTFAYGSALGLDIGWLREVNKKFIQPDQTIYLLPPLAVCTERLARRVSRDMLEDDSLRADVYGAYLQLSESEPDTHVIDTSGDKVEASDRIVRIVQEVLAREVA
ncbi:MAG: dTMP kinase [Candidatus Peregrinibacteria bacterium]|nr:dTMP kinase [Candidatus Peregrinibacteria bacterium]